MKVGDIVRMKEKDWISDRKPLFRVVAVDGCRYIKLEWVEDDERKEIEEMYYRDVMTMIEGYPEYVDVKVSVPKQFEVFYFDEDDFEVVDEGEHISSKVLKDKSLNTYKR